VTPHAEAGPGRTAIAMARPRIKTGHDPARVTTGKIRMGGHQIGIAYELDDPSGVVWQLLGLLDGSRTRDQVVADLLRAHPDLHAGSVREVIDLLIEHGSVEDAAATPPRVLDPAELDRYSRNVAYFSWADRHPRASPYHHQLRLRESSVTILGVGGTGSSVALSLAAMGVGRIRLADHDTVELSNLNRQLLYEERDVGRRKITAAVERLQALNSAIEVSGAEIQAGSSDDIASLMESCDLFALCADTPPEVSHWVNDAALRTRTPWVTASYGGPIAVAGLFVPFETPCWECLRRHNVAADADIFTEKLWPDNKFPVQPIIAPVAAIAGHLAALLASYFLTGMEIECRGGLLHYNMLDFEHVYLNRHGFAPDCPSCGAAERAGDGHGS
jgi:molybdopterin-synthase adenylyltransferase